MSDNDKERDSEVENSHHRTRTPVIFEICLLPPKNSRGKNESQYDTHCQRGIFRVKETVSAEGVCDIKRSYEIKPAHISQMSVTANSTPIQCFLSAAWI